MNRQKLCTLRKPKVGKINNFSPQFLESIVKLNKGQRKTAYKPSLPESDNSGKGSCCSQLSRAVFTDPPGSGHNSERGTHSIRSKN